CLLFLVIRPPPPPTLFPYTTLFRSVGHAGDFRADISRILKYAPDQLIGRETELKLLHDAWLKVRRVERPRANILTFVALGGEGRSEEHTSELQSLRHLVCRLLLEKK